MSFHPQVQELRIETLTSVFGGLSPPECKWGSLQMGICDISGASGNCGDTRPSISFLLMRQHLSCQESRYFRSWNIKGHISPTQSWRQGSPAHAHGHRTSEVDSSSRDQGSAVGPGDHWRSLPTEITLVYPKGHPEQHWGTTSM